MSAAPSMLPLVAGLVIFGTLGLETLRSARNERSLRRRGAHVATDPSYPYMRAAYPGGFLAVCLEGWWRGVSWVDPWVAAGLTIFFLGKALKYAAIATLGERWTFRIVVLPHAPLVDRGIYRWLRHPNYLGVVAEVVGSAMWLRAPITGTLFAGMFGLILSVRIRHEERALGLVPRG